MKKRTRMLSFLLSLLLAVFHLPVSIYGTETEPAGETIDLTVHYQTAAGDEELDWKLWVWGEGLAGQVYEFTEEDAYGQIAVLEVPAEWGKIGIIARGDEGATEWVKQTADLFPTIRDNQAEIWLRGTENQVYYTEPGEVSTETLTDLTLNIHYVRYTDQVYEPWNVWAWVGDGDGAQYDFTEQADGSHMATVELSDPEGIESVGLIVRKSEDSNDWAAKNTPEDIILSSFSGDTVDLWVAEGDGTLYYSEAEIPDVILDVVLSTETTADLTLSKAITRDQLSSLEVTGAEVGQVDFTDASLAESNLVTVSFAAPVEKSQDLTFRLDGFGQYTLRQLLTWLHSQEFNDEYYFDGELGAIYTPEQTTLRLWAPTATAVNLLTFVDEQESSTPMNAAENGTWEIVLEGDVEGLVYNYELTFADGTTNVSVDPYAKAVTANGLQTVVLDPAKANPENWAAERVSFDGGYTDAIIYEAHIRDLTIGPNNGIENKGKFLGLTETGTTTANGNLSGLDYLKSLGVTHVQILPMYDFKSIDETGPLGYGEAYNWGYDPQNYNVPEGSYSTDPTDPSLRITEMKQMIQALHDAGLYVIMDVVYNHVFDVTSSPLNLTVPGYYFRYDANGNLRNGTGVGNETASEQSMYRRYMVDSLKYWAEEYQIDGFRFDLMGIHDTVTMNEIEEELHAIDPSLILLGEGWEMGFHPADVTPSDQYHADELPGYAFFNDSFRDLVKGSVFEQTEPGWVNGMLNSEFVYNIYNNILGAQHVRDYLDASQSVLYNEAHDNLTMWDKLKATNPDEEDEITVKRHLLADTLQMLGNGMAFVHAGQEFMRTKGGDHNSYISPDTVNELNYDRAADFSESFEYFKALIELRRSEPLFRLTDYDEINGAYELLADPTRDFLQYKVSDPETGEAKYLLFFNAAEEAQTVELPDGNYVLFDSADSEGVDTAAFEIPALSAAVLQVSDVAVVPTEPAETAAPTAVTEAEVTAVTEPDFTEVGEGTERPNRLPSILIGAGLVVVLGIAVSVTQKHAGPLAERKKKDPPENPKK